jgi:hypothetical protein
MFISSKSRNNASLMLNTDNVLVFFFFWHGPKFEWARAKRYGSGYMGVFSLRKILALAIITLSFVFVNQCSIIN